MVTTTPPFKYVFTSLLLLVHWRLSLSFLGSFGSLKRSDFSHSRIWRRCTKTAGMTAPFTDSIQVFDNVFSPDVCEELHYLALDHADRCGVRSSIFYWSQNADSDGLLTPLEQAIKSCLQQLPLPGKNDRTKPAIVEYWSRDEYLNMDAHSDIDERELLNEGTLRCPHFGHVLYMQVAPSVRGPTCVFSQYGGWNGGDEISLVTVPAVEGRVLRFPGAAMHAVPKPATLWLLDQEEQKKITASEENIDIDYDAWDDEDDVMQRSVILFNVWLGEGPFGVPEDLDAKSMLPDGIELVVEEDDKNDQEKQNQQKKERQAVWEEEYGADCCDLWCQPRDEWKEMGILDNPDSDADQRLCIALMGNKARRLHPQSHALVSSSSVLAEALQSATTPQHFTLRGAR